MMEDGICEVLPGKLYSATLEMEDTDYLLLSEEGKRQKNTKFAQLLDGTDAKTTLQFSVISVPITEDYFNKNLALPAGGSTTLDACQQEMNDYLCRLSSKGFVTKKLLTLCVEAPDLETGRHYITEKAARLRSSLNALGCSAQLLNGSNRLDAVQELLRPYAKQPVDYRQLAIQNIGTKDIIAPSSFAFKDIKLCSSNGTQLPSPCIFRSGEHYGVVLALYGSGIPSVINDEFVHAVSCLPFRTAISIFAQPAEQSWAVEKVQSVIGSMDAVETSKIRSAAAQGIPDRLATTVKFSEEKRGYEVLYENLSERNQQYYKSGVFVATFADDPQTVADQAAKIQGAVSQHSFRLETVDYASEAALNTMLPLGVNFTPYHFGLITAAQSMFIPFTAPDLLCPHGVWLGQNAQSKNPIFCLVKTMGMNGNGMVLGKPGSGKSIYVKLLAAQYCILFPDDEIIILDVEGEYGNFVKNLGGEVITLSSGSGHYINPFDVTESYADTGKEQDAEWNVGYRHDTRNEAIIGKKSAFIQNFISSSVSEPLTTKELTVLDLAGRAIYSDYIGRFRRGNHTMPTFTDFITFLQRVGEKNTVLAHEAEELAAKLIVFTEGNLTFFNHQTNVDITNKLTCFDISGLTGQHRKIGLSILLDYIWNRLSVNRGRLRDTHFFVEEFQSLTKDDTYTAHYFESIYARARKFGGYPIAVTQNVDVLLSSESGRSMVKNSEMVVMLKQEGDDAEQLCEMFHLSPDQTEHITSAQPGHGLFRYGEHIIPFNAEWSSQSKLYKLMTTKLSDLREICNK